MPFFILPSFKDRLFTYRIFSFSKGTTALGGAVEDAKPSRMLEDIRAAGEEIPSECEVFNANLEMSGEDVTFEEVIEVRK